MGDETAGLFVTDATRPEDAWARPDWFNLAAHANNELPEGWRWVSLEVLDGGRDRATLMKGGVFKTLWKSGKRKGHPNLSKPEPGTERRLVVTDSQVDAEQQRHEREVGKCHECGGVGQVSYGWDVKTGAHAPKPCRTCKGTGKPKESR